MDASQRLVFSSISLRICTRDYWRYAYNAVTWQAKFATRNIYPYTHTHVDAIESHTRACTTTHLRCVPRASESQRVQEASSLGIRTIVANSCLWDIGAGLATYMIRLATFLEKVRTYVAPAAAAVDAALPPDLELRTPRRWLWRTAIPTVHSRLDNNTKKNHSPGNVHAFNMFARGAVKAYPGPSSPRWELIDMLDIIPPGLETHFLSTDGYHATSEAQEITVQVTLNMLCSPTISQNTLEGIAGH